MKFASFKGDLTNKTDQYYVLLGYYGSYVVNDNQGNQADTVINAIPAAVIPPGYALTGGTRGYGIYVDIGNLAEWI